MLEVKAAELLRTLRRREGIEIEIEADAFDEAQRITERDLAIHNLDRDSILLRNIRVALARIANGSYGICVRCEEEIAPRRLAAVPWAPLCIDCQEQADTEGSDPVIFAHGVPAADEDREADAAA
jgi:DnaK suppressor protein